MPSSRAISWIVVSRKPFSANISAAVLMISSYFASRRCSRAIAFAVTRPSRASTDCSLSDDRPPCRQRGSEHDGDGLQAGIELRAFTPLLLAPAALLESTEGQGDVHRLPVHPDRARVEPVREPVDSRHVAGPHLGGETVGGAVRHLDRLVRGTERDDVDDGAEDLLLHHRGV